mmetsp:Transcript_791/g.2841  ORF Transcript_791/g.2841 Transcript_791/m.2841 type:complete len:213 (-) Transcript_791:376-1014(-)
MNTLAFAPVANSPSFLSFELLLAWIIYTIFSTFSLFTVMHATLSLLAQLLLILAKIAPCPSTSSSSSYVPIAVAMSPLIVLEIETPFLSSSSIEDHFSENRPLTNATTFAPSGTSAKNAFMSSSTSASLSSSLTNVALVISETSKKTPRLVPVRRRFRFRELFRRTRAHAFDPRFRRRFRRHAGIPRLQYPLVISFLQGRRRLRCFRRRRPS